MNDIRLILIEGIMGSGKSTTAAFLADRIQQQGREVTWYHEYARDNPILVDVLAGFECTDDWKIHNKTLPQWQTLGRTKRDDDTVTILESKLWQNDNLFMLLAGVPTADVIASNLRVVDALAEARPALIHFTFDNLEDHLRWIFENRRTLGGPHPPQIWKEWIVEVFVSSEFGKDNGWTGFEGFMAGCSEWLSVCERMFQNFDGPKLDVRNPHADWDKSYLAIADLIGVQAPTV